MSDRFFDIGDGQAVDIWQAASDCLHVWRVIGERAGFLGTFNVPLSDFATGGVSSARAFDSLVMLRDAGWLSDRSGARGVPFIVDMLGHGQSGVGRIDYILTAEEHVRAQARLRRLGAGAERAPEASARPAYRSGLSADEAAPFIVDLMRRVVRGVLVHRLRGGREVDAEDEPVWRAAAAR